MPRLQCERGAPHIEHPTIRCLFTDLASRVYFIATSERQDGGIEVLDLGAGSGYASFPFLEQGCNVTAVDISRSKLEALSLGPRSPVAGALTLVCTDADQALDALRQRGATFDIVVACSFLHHVPDYLSLVEKATLIVRKKGFFFSFQDPIRYDTLPALTRILGAVLYAAWRVRQAGVVGGAIRYFRRRVLGIWSPRCVADNDEYHVVRNGVDHNAICALLNQHGFQAEVIRYFSTQSRLGQRLGESLGLLNYFAIVAQRRG